MTSKPFQPVDFRDRFPALDGIRALAVTLVFVNHFGGGAHGGPLLNLLNAVRLRGWVGVDIFFVLSGFLITGILYDTRNDSHFFKRFFARRSLRIFPVFYVTIAILLALTPLLHYEWRLGQLPFLVYLGNLTANGDFSLYDVPSRIHPAFNIFGGHFWSLCVEEQFYLLWPLVVWWLRDRIKLIRAAGLLSILALLLRVWLFHATSPQIAERWAVRTLPFRMDTLLIGGLMALLLRGPNAARWQKLSGPLLLAAGGAALGWSAWNPVYDAAWLLTIGFTLTALASAGLIGLALPAGSAAFRVFYRKPLRLLGKYSYGFYIFHVLFAYAWIALLARIVDRTHSRALAGILVLGLNFGVTLLVSKLSYEQFEVKFLRWKTHFEYDAEVRAHKHAFTTK